MEAVVPYLRGVHIGAGALALLVLAIPIVTKKGGRAHVVVGRVYAIAMAVVALTAWPITAARLSDDSKGNDESAIFLAYIAILSANTTLVGVRALRTKRRKAPSWLDAAPSLLLVAAAVGAIVFGARGGGPLFYVFGALGVVLGGSQVRFWTTTPASPRESIYVHIGALGASGIATVTAFLVVNASNLGFGENPIAVWVAPGVVGAALIVYAQRKWRAPKKAAALDA